MAIDDHQHTDHKRRKMHGDDATDRLARVLREVHAAPIMASREQLARAGVLAADVNAAVRLGLVLELPGGGLTLSNDGRQRLRHYT